MQRQTKTESVRDGMNGEKETGEREVDRKGRKRLMERQTEDIE